MNIYKKLANRLLYHNDPEMIYHPQRKNQEFLSWEAVAGSIGLSMINGTFQTRFLLKLGANIEQLSLLASLLLVATISSLFGGLVFERRKKKKMLLTWMLLSARVIMASMYFLPFFISDTILCTKIFMVVTILSTCTTSLADIGYAELLNAVTTPNIRGRVLAVRSVLIYFITPILPLIAAYFLDHNDSSLTAFATLACFGILMLILEAVLLSRVKEPEYQIHEKDNAPLKDRVRHFADQVKNARPYMTMLGESFLFYLFLYICGTFTTTYLNSSEYIGCTAMFLQIASIFLNLTMMVLVRIFGKLCDRIGAGKMLFLMQLTFGFEMLMWVVVPPKWLPTAIFIPYIFQAVSNSMSSVTVFSRKFELIPEQNQSMFLGLYGAVIAIAYLIGPAIGRFLLHFFERHLSQQMLDGFWHIRLIYLAGACMIFLQKLYTVIFKRKFEV